MSEDFTEKLPTNGNDTKILTAIKDLDKKVDTVIKDLEKKVDSLEKRWMSDFTTHVQSGTRLSQILLSCKQVKNDLNKVYNLCESI
jgi:hypothetical protein